MYFRPESLIDVSSLVKQIDDPSLAIIDASYYLPSANRDVHSEFNRCHLPNAVFFDIDEIADQHSNLPHMLPDAKFFSEKVGNLGISRDHHVVCYDTNIGAMAAMRVFWMFKVFGHQKVSILNGGFKSWVDNGFHTESGQTFVRTASYLNAKVDPNLVRTIDQVRNNLLTGAEQLVDARSSGRFNGSEKEPRNGLDSGHIPASISLPYDQLFDSKSNSIFIGAEEIKLILNCHNIDISKPIISSCGSGVTAAVLYFCLHLIGYDTVAIYDGSWTEWASRKDTPIISNEISLNEET